MVFQRVAAIGSVCQDPPMLEIEEIWDKSVDVNNKEDEKASDCEVTGREGEGDSQWQ